MRRFLTVAISALILAPIGLLVLLPSLSHWALDSYIDEIAAGGEPVHPREIIGPEIPQDENFFETSILVHLRNQELSNTGSFPWEAEEIIDWDSIPEIQISNSPKHPVLRYFAPLNYDHLVGGLSARECLQKVRECTEEMRHTIEALESASRRPSAWKVFDEGMGFDPAYEVTRIYDVLKFLQLRCALTIESGSAEAATEDLLTSLRIARHLMRHPTLLNHLVGIASLEKSVMNLNAGLRKFEWSENDLKRISEELCRLKVEASFLRTVRFERSILIQLVKSDRRIPTGATPPSLLRWEFLNDRLYHINWLRYFSGIQEGLLVDESGALAFDSMPSPEQFSQVIGELSSSRAKRILYFEALSILPFFDNIPTKSKRASVAVNHARVAILLELHRQKHSEFPDQLAELVGEFDRSLLLDPMNGEEMSYRRLSDGTYELYSVGVNGLDESGLLKEDFQSGDWVWRLTLPKDFDLSEYKKSPM